MNSVIESKTAIGSKWKWVLGFVVLVALAAGIGLAIHFKGLTNLRPAVEDALLRLGAWAPLAFILIYIVACVALIPASILTLAAGAVFGVIKGAVYVNIAATLGATAAFLNGRYLARDSVARKIGGHARFEAIDRAVADEGWKIVFLTRLCPILPFFLLNYAFGLTRVRLKDYFWASWLGMIPGTTLFVYIGSLANPAEARRGPIGWTLKILGLVLLVVISVYLTRIARKGLSRRISDPPDAGGEESIRSRRTTERK
jgi:uncharacterized membrane protein YdjX (TVP38/TMEM64 family)